MINEIKNFILFITNVKTEYFTFFQFRVFRISLCKYLSDGHDDRLELGCTE
jgi:hypothetical protein